MTENQLISKIKTKINSEEFLIPVCQLIYDYFLLNPNKIANTKNVSLIGVGKIKQSNANIKQQLFSEDFSDFNNKKQLLLLRNQKNNDYIACLVPSKSSAKHIKDPFFMYDFPCYKKTDLVPIEKDDIIFKNDFGDVIEVKPEYFTKALNFYGLLPPTAKKVNDNISEIISKEEILPPLNDVISSTSKDIKSIR